MKKIVFTRPDDGGVSVVTPAAPELLQRVFDAIPKELGPVVVDHTDLPTDRSKRDAWTLNNGKVSIDSAKAAKL